VTARDDFQREGYALVPAVLTPAQLQSLRAACLEIFATAPAGDDTETVRLDVFTRFEAFRWLWKHPPFIAALRDVFGDDFAVVTESAIHDSGYGGWHRDTESQEVHGERFQRQPDFQVGQVALYLQDNTVEYGGGLDVVPRAHLERDPQRLLWRLKLHSLYHRRVPEIVKNAIHHVRDLRPRPIDEAAFDRRKLAIPSKAGDLVMFDLRIPHKASHPKITPVPPEHRKLALFVVCGRNNRGTQLYRQYIGTRIDYGYLRGHAQPPAMRALASETGFSLL
jgi:Phytanoyl-CoA dioxygenase (PhyH)